MEEARSVHGVPIRLTAEPWDHITGNHPELEDMLEGVLLAVEHPDWITAGSRGSRIAWKGYGKRGFLAVIYKETGRADGFIITAHFTSKASKRRTIWP